MVRKQVYSAIACALLIAACDGPAVDAGAEKAAIRALLDQQVVDWNNADIDGFMEGYWRSDSLQFLSSSRNLGWEPVRDRYHRVYGTADLMGKLKFEIFQIDLLGRDYAKVSGMWNLKRAEDAPGGYFTLILQNRAEGWRIIHDHTSSAS